MVRSSGGTLLFYNYKYKEDAPEDIAGKWSAGVMAQDMVTQYNKAVIYNYNSTADQTDNVTIRGNTIKYGSNGVWWSGSTASKESGTVIVDNVFEEFSQRGVWVQ